MVSVIVVGIVIALCIYQCYKYCFYRPANYPPGPPRLPFFGSMLFVLAINYKNKFMAINKLCEYYKTSVLGFHVGPHIALVANDPTSIRELLLKPEFDGRNDGIFPRLRSPDFSLKGIFNIDSDFWLHQRRFSLRHLRDFGFGRRDQDYEIEVQSEMKGLVDIIKDGPKYEHEKKYFKPGGIVFMPKALIAFVGNCFLQACVSQRLARPDQHKLFKFVDKISFVLHCPNFLYYILFMPLERAKVHLTL